MHTIILWGQNSKDNMIWCLFGLRPTGEQTTNGLVGWWRDKIVIKEKTESVERGEQCTETKFPILLKQK